MDYAWDKVKSTVSFAFESNSDTMFSLSVHPVQTTVPAQHAAISYASLGLSISSVLLIFIIIDICIEQLLFAQFAAAKPIGRIKKEGKVKQFVTWAADWRLNSHTHSRTPDERALSRNNRSCLCVNKTQTTLTHTYTHTY